jgi:hypothetical protein
MDADIDVFFFNVEATELTRTMMDAEALEKRRTPGSRVSSPCLADSTSGKTFRVD